MILFKAHKKILYYRVMSTALFLVLLPFLLTNKASAAHLVTIDDDFVKGSPEGASQVYDYDLYDSDRDKNIMVGYDNNSKKVFLYVVNPNDGSVNQKKEIFDCTTIRGCMGDTGGGSISYGLVGIKKGINTYLVTIAVDYSFGEWGTKLILLDSNFNQIGEDSLQNGDISAIKSTYNSVDNKFTVFFSTWSSPITTKKHHLIHVSASTGSILEIKELNYDPYFAYSNTGVYPTLEAEYNPNNNQYLILASTHCTDHPCDVISYSFILDNNGDIIESHRNDFARNAREKDAVFLPGRNIYLVSEMNYGIPQSSIMVMLYTIKPDGSGGSMIRQINFGAEGSVLAPMPLERNYVPRISVDYVDSEIVLVWTKPFVATLDSSIPNAMFVQKLNFDGTLKGDRIEIPFISNPLGGWGALGLNITHNGNGKFLISLTADHHIAGPKFLACLETGCFPNFTLLPNPLRNATNPNWSEDYSASITRQGGFNGAVTLSSSVAIGAADLNITWLDGNTIPAGEEGPKIMRVQAKDPPTESKRGTNYDITITGTSGNITKNQDIDFYVNKRPVAQPNILDSPTMNQGDYFRIRDNNLTGSYDPDNFAPGNVLQIFVADFDGDGAVDKCFSLIAIPGCSSNPSDDPRTNIWQFQYNNPGNYTLTYAVLDDLFNDGPAPFSWAEALKSAGVVTLGITVKSVSPGNAPTAVIEIQDAGGSSIDNALAGQNIYAHTGNSTDTDGNISLVSFCVDTTPEAGNAPKNCDGSITPWIIPPFGWNISDAIRGWSGVDKKWKTKMDIPGVYAIYTAVQDNDSLLSEVAMDTITIDAIAVSTLKVCVEKCNSGGSNLLGSTLIMNKNSTVKLRACYNSAPQCNDATGDVTAPPTIWNDTNSPENSVSLSFNGFDEEVKSGGNIGDEDVQVTYGGNPAQTFTVNVQGSSVCGNGVKEGSEKCDDGVASNGSCPRTCSAICTINNCSGIGNWKEIPPK